MNRRDAAGSLRVYPKRMLPLTRSDRNLACGIDIYSEISDRKTDS